MEGYEDRLAIATPEGVQVELVLAGLGSRFTAALIDLLLKLVLLVAVLVVVAVLGTLGAILLSIAALAIYIGYDILFEVFAGGRTPGKRRTGLRVLRADGRPVDLLSSAIRNVVRLVDGITLAYLPGMLFILVTRRNQRLGDVAGRTIVVKETAVTLPEATSFAAPPSVPGTLDVTAVTPQDLGALRAFLGRRAQLAPEARGDLARRMAGAVAPRVGGAVAHLGAEELIERVVAAKDAARS